jgi:hypothetical protein
MIPENRDSVRLWPGIEHSGYYPKQGVSSYPTYSIKVVIPKGCTEQGANKQRPNTQECK